MSLYGEYNDGVKELKGMVILTVNLNDRSHIEQIWQEEESSFGAYMTRD